MEITAVIPVRGGSTRIKNKNIKPFADSNLLEIKINQLKRIKDIAFIVVSSDSKEMLEIAKKNDVIAKERPLKYCDEKSKSFNEVVSFIAENHVMTDVVIWTPCVCPLIKDKSIINAINIFNYQQGYDSVCSVALIKEYIYGLKGPVNFSIENHVKSQELPNWYRIVNGFFIAERNKMIEWQFLYGRKPYLFEIEKEEAIDIDDEYDFMVAEYLYKK